VLDGTLAIHCVQLPGDDIDVLAARTAGVVLCPRSNAYLDEGPAPVAALERCGHAARAGHRLQASNLDLDLLDEARAVRQLAPALAAERVVRMVTADGAAALGMGGVRVSGPGYQADLAIFRCAADAPDPYEGLIGCVGRPSLESVMAGGEWRVREGRVLEIRPTRLDSAARAGEGGRAGCAGLRSRSAGDATRPGSKSRTGPP
jgi:cytosine/adenosine deaminase-related metal-dependent hydrolase